MLECLLRRKTESTQFPLFDKALVFDSENLQPCTRSLSSEIEDSIKFLENLV